MRDDVSRWACGAELFRKWLRNRQQNVIYVELNDNSNSFCCLWKSKLAHSKALRNCHAPLKSQSTSKRRFALNIMRICQFATETPFNRASRSLLFLMRLKGREPQCSEHWAVPIISHSYNKFKYLNHFHLIMKDRLSHTLTIFHNNLLFFHSPHILWILNISFSLIFMNNNFIIIIIIIMLMIYSARRHHVVSYGGLTQLTQLLLSWLQAVVDAVLVDAWCLAWC